MHRKTAQKSRHHRSPNRFLKYRFHERHPLEEYETGEPSPVNEGTELGTAEGRQVVAKTTVSTGLDPDHAKHVAVARQMSVPHEIAEVRACYATSIDEAIVDGMNLPDDGNSPVEGGEVLAATG